MSSSVTSVKYWYQDDQMLGAGRRAWTPLAAANVSAKAVFAPAIPAAEAPRVTLHGPSTVNDDPVTLDGLAADGRDRLISGFRRDRHDVLTVAGVQDQQSVALEHPWT